VLLLASTGKARVRLEEPTHRLGEGKTLAQFLQGSDPPAGAFAGILVGAVVAAVLSFTHATIGSLFPALPQAIRDLNVGIIALAANIVAMVVVSAVTRPRTVPAGTI